MAEILKTRESIAKDILGFIDESGFCRCPGAFQHTHRNGRRDCRVRLDGAPTVYCVHTSCAAVLDEVNYRLRSRIASAERTMNQSCGQSGGVAKPARSSGPVRPPTIPPFDPVKLERLAKVCRCEITLDWLAARSPVTIPPVEEQQRDGRACSRLFVDALYRPNERILVFTRFYSQGDFLAVSRGDSYRLGDRPDVKASRAHLPTSGDEGVWYQTAPVTAGWEPVPSPDSRLGRRHEACVTRFPFLLLESDTAEESLWLKALVQLPLRIAALYTSGGKSIHALIKVDCETKAEFDAARNVARSVLCPLGADGAAMSAVRLSRLPGCLRHGKTEGQTYRRFDQPQLQRLVYLNPSPPRATALVDLLK